MSKRIADWLLDRHRGCILLLTAAVLALYVPYTGNPFFFDDIPFFSGQASPEPWLEALQKLRGLPYNTLRWTWLWFGTVLTHAYRLPDAVLHAANAVALFFLLVNVTTLQLPQRETSERVWLCLLASLLFALNPVASYAAAYIVQRSIVMATLFGLLAQLAWVKAWSSGRLGLAAASISLYYLACFSKEHAVVLPVVMAALGLLLARERRLSWLAVGACAMAALGIAVYVLMRRSDVIGVSYEPMATHLFTQAKVQASGASLQLLSIATQAQLFFRYCLLWLLPLPAWMAIDMRVEFMPALADWRVWGGLAAFAACGLLALRWLFKPGMAGLVGLALLAPMSLFVVEFSTVRVQEAFVLYRSYLWMPLLMLLPALLALCLLDHLAPRARHIARYLLPTALLALLTCGVVNRLQVASDAYALWDDAARLLTSDDQPGADRILYNRAQAALASGRTGQAVADLERVAQISPALWQVWQLLGIAHLNNEQPKLAQSDFNRALALHPGDGALLYARAIALRRNGHPAEAMTDLTASCEAKWTAACVVTAALNANRRGQPSK